MTPRAGPGPCAMPAPRPAMKTETVLRAVTKGTVKGVACKKGDMVEEGRELVEIDPSEESS